MAFRHTKLKGLVMQHDQTRSQRHLHVLGATEAPFTLAQLKPRPLSMASW